MEAPPSVISTYLGEDMTAYLMDFVESGKLNEYTPVKKSLGEAMHIHPIKPTLKARAHSPETQPSGSHSAPWAKLRDWSTAFWKRDLFRRA